MVRTIDKPEEVGFSSEKLKNIRTEMEKHIGKGKFNGALGLIESKGKIAYCESFGVADEESKKAIKTDTIFRIYSMTKPITSVAAGT